mgnify:CR=1 FL=1
MFKKNAMKLIGFLEYGGFGALVSRRLLITYLAEKYGRSAVIVYRNCLYDDPYTSEHTIPEGTEIVPFTYSKDQDDKYAFFDFDYYWNNDLKFREFGSFDTEFDYIEKGETLSKITLKDSYKDIVSDMVSKFPQISDSIAVQIRRGDKTDETPYVPYQAYVDHCKDIRAEHGISSVFLTSDSLSALLEVKELLKEEGFNCFFDEEEHRYDNANHRMVQGNPTLKVQESLTGTKIIYFMSKAQHILGQKNTHFTQLAAMLQAYRTQSIDGFTLITPPEK